MHFIRLISFNSIINNVFKTEPCDDVNNEGHHLRVSHLCV